MSAGARGAAGTFYQRANRHAIERERWQAMQDDMHRLAGKDQRQIAEDEYEQQRAFALSQMDKE